MMSKPTRWIALGFAWATSVLSLGACAPRSAYVEVDYAPRNIVAYPHVIYAGRTTYYVDGRWYYRHGSRWVYYTDPPPRLREYRYERAPRAYREGRYEYEHERRDEAHRRGFERDRREEAHRREHEHDRREEAHRHARERDRREHEAHADAREREHAQHRGRDVD